MEDSLLLTGHYDGGIYRANNKYLEEVYFSITLGHAHENSLRMVKTKIVLEVIFRIASW
jgi:hypothetical protein